MSKELKVLEKRQVLGFGFKIYGTFENPLFLAKEVAMWLELTNVTDMISRVDKEEVTKLNLGGRQGETWFLTEDGLYEVLFQSRKPIARSFKKEVKRILKEIRVNGYKHKAEQQSLQWQDTRNQGKVQRRLLTDAIQVLEGVFIDDGSKNGSRLYSQYTTMINKSIGIKERDESNTSQLAQIAFIEDLCSRMILMHVAQNTDRKEIYYICKAQVETITAISRNALLAIA